MKADMMATVKRERLTEALVRDLTVDGVVVWIHSLQDREEFLEGKLHGTETLLDGAMALVGRLEAPYLAWHEAKSGAAVDAAIDAIVRMGAALAAEKGDS